MNTMSVATYKVVWFIHLYAPKALGSLPGEKLERWLSTREAQGELSVVATPHGKVLAVGAATEQPDGVVHVDLLIGRGGAWRRCLEHVRQRWPDWQTRTFTAVRRGRHRRVNMKRLLTR
jgi:hypothetical protein